MSKAKGRAIAFLLAFCMVFTGVFSGNVAEVKAEESSILTECMITLNNAELTENTKVKNGDNLKLNFEWALEDGNDTSEYVIDLNLYGIQIANASTPQDISKLSVGVVGQYWIDSEGKLHLVFDTSIPYFSESLRSGGITLDGIVNVDKNAVDDHDPIEVGWSEDLYKVIFSYGDPKSWMDARKELSGPVTKDANGDLWQEFKVTLTAYDNDVKNLNVKDVAGAKLTNASAIQVAGTVSGGDGLQSSYANMDELNAALSGTTLLKDESLVLTYKMQVAEGIYAQNVTSGEYQNHLEYSYETNEQQTESKWSNTVEVAVNRPAISKSGVANANQDEITWTIRITLGDFSEEGFDAAVNQVMDQVGAGLEGAGSSKDIKSLFAEDPQNPGTYVAAYTTKVEYEGLNNAANTVQMTIDEHTYSATANVPLTPDQWISKSCLGKQNGYLVWDVYLTPTDYVQNVVLADVLDNNQQFATAVWVDDKEVLAFDSPVWGQNSWSGTYTEEANGIIKNYSAGMKQYNPLQLSFADEYIKGKVDSNSSIKITYRTVITNTNASEVVNRATVSYYDPQLQEETSQTAIATWVDDGSTVTIDKDGWEQNGNTAMKYEMVIDYDKYKHLDRADLVDYQFEVVDVLPAGLKTSTYINDWTPVLTVMAGDNYNQNVEVPYVKSTRRVTVDGEEREELTLTLTMSQTVIDKLKNVRDNTTFKPIIKITLWADIVDVAELVRAGSKTFVNTVKSEFDGIPLEDTHERTVTAPSVVRKTEQFDVKTGINYYTIYINEGGLDLSVNSDKLSGIDTMGSLVQYMFDTVKVENITGGESNAVELIKGTEYKYTYSAENNQLIFEDLPDEVPLKITYQAQIQLIDGSIAEGDFTSDDVKNVFKLYGFSSDATQNSSSVITSVSHANLDGWAVSAVGSITIQKYWTNGGQMVALDGAVFDIYSAKYDTTLGKMVLVDKVQENIKITSADGTVTVGNLPLKSIYALVETEAPYGYGSAEPYYFVLRNERDSIVEEVLKDIPEGLVNEFVDGVTVLYENEPANGDLVLEKSFSGLTLAAGDKEKISFTISPKAGLKDTYTLNDFTETNGTYTLTIKDVPTGDYTVTEARQAVDGYTFKEMTYQVSTNGTQQSSGSEGANATTATQMSAKVEEDKTTTVAVTNTYEENVDITVTKTWEHGNNFWMYPTEITINLLANGTKVDSKTVTAGENWSCSFTDLAPCDANGNEIEYTITEDNVDNYSTTITGSAADGFTVSNVYSPNTTSVTVTKVWDDNNNQDGIRPPSVQVQLYRNNVAVSEAEGGVITLPVNGQWIYTWNDLVKNAGGWGTQDFVYTVKEIAFADGSGYDSTVEGDMTAGFTITNSHTPATTSVSVNKTWNDGNNQDGKRPASITVNLMSGTGNNKTLVETAQITEANDGSWSHIFDNLPKYEAGEEIVYSITEDTVFGYTTEITGDAAVGFSITNTHEPETVDLKLTKIWDDADNQDNIRPTSITVSLMSGEGNNKKLEATKEITAAQDGTWTCSFEDLPVYKNGTMIKYTLEEEAVAGYEASLSGDLYNGYTITNTHEPETVNISISKVWDDADNQDGKRPDKITVNLLDGTTVIDSKETTANLNWNCSFTNLPKYRAGKVGEEIPYGISEATVENYTASVDGSVANGFILTNTHALETVEVNGAKTWNDSNDQDGKRPNSITISVMDGDTTVATKSVTANDGWEWSFTGLPKYRDGKVGEEITYTISEVRIDEYDTVINGYNVTNSYTPGKTFVTVSKVWNDADNQDGKRPASVTVQLLADGVACREAVTLSGTNGWTYKWDDLELMNAGEKISYTVKEFEVEGYEVDIQPNDSATGYIITNTHIPETVDIAGSKTWVDNNNALGNRPDNITIILKANGSEKERKTVSAADDWKWSFAGLDKYADGEEIVYTIDEADIAAYEKSVNGYDVTNTFVANRGRLILKKAIIGLNEAAMQAAENAVAFTVTDDKGNITTYSLSQFTYDTASGQYILELPVEFRVAIGGMFTVAETSYEMDGYKASVKVNGTTVEGNKATVVMERDVDSIVSFENTYVKVVEPTPTPVPTATPTVAPTATPTAVPTATPTAVPTATPTAVPTATPTAVPTATPTAVPTATPTAVPTATPTAVPTATPTAVPTTTPTVAPSATPTVAPTATPTVAPTATPTVAPSATPTVAPSATPTIAPTATPTVAPSATPTIAPSAMPTVAPTATPTVAPTATPTIAPSVTPTVVPTTTPTIAPSATPTVAPTATPTVAPSATPTIAPSVTPTVAPTATPSASPAPTVTPTSEPVPTQAPTQKPAVTPAPTQKPTVVTTPAPATPAPTPVQVPVTVYDDMPKNRR